MGHLVKNFGAKNDLVDWYLVVDSTDRNTPIASQGVWQHIDANVAKWIWDHVDGTGFYYSKYQFDTTDAVHLTRSGNNMRLAVYGDASYVSVYDQQNTTEHSRLGKDLLLLSGTYKRQTDPSLTATGSDQSGALDLSATEDWYKIIAGAVDTGVELPALTAGVEKRVSNATNTNKKLYPNGTEFFIYAGTVYGAGIAIDLPAYTNVIVSCYQTGQGIVK